MESLLHAQVLNAPAASNAPVFGAAPALDRAVAFAARTQHPEGFWEQAPDPRIFDTALSAICLAAAGPAGQAAVERARTWLASATPQAHEAYTATVDCWLREVAMGEVGAPLPVSSGDRRAPSGRELLIETLAVCVGSPGGDPRRLLRLVTAAGPRAGTKQWQRALLAAAEIIAQARSGATVRASAIDELEAEQGDDGDFCLMPAVTGLAYAALASTGENRASTRRCLAHILRSQGTDGTWRYLSFDIWDTTLMVRSLRGVPAFDAQLRDPALGFIARTQSADGGWACKHGIESDNDTTGSALLALAGTDPDPRILEAAERYLRRVQREDGSWLTWQSSDDTPSCDVTAHVAMAVAAHPGMQVETARATAWLEAQQRGPGGWRAQWYPTHAYAVAEIAAAVGWDREASRAAVRQLIAQQRPDGGWSIFPGDRRSDPAVTGLALSACVRSGIAVGTAQLRNAAAWLVEAQTTDGTWSGQPMMAGPRPFLNHLPLHTHAFAAAGLRDFVQFGVGD